MNNMIKWVKTNSAYFAKIQTKLPNTMYLLEDTMELYNGDKNYSSDLIAVNSLPTDPIPNKLYITPNRQCRTWNGTEWITIVPEISGTLQDGVDASGLVTGNAIKEYVTTKINNLGGGVGPGGEGGSLTGSASNITIAKDMKVLGQSIGSYSDGDIIKAGTNVSTILQNMLAKCIPPVYKKPTLSIRPGQEVYEIGSLISPTISAIFTKNDCGEISKYTLTEINGSISSNLVTDTTIKPYTIPHFTLGQSLKYIAEVDYTEGPIKEDNLGQAYPNGRIPAGSITSSMNIIAARKMFYGATKKTIAETSDGIRLLPNSYLSPYSGQTITIPIAVGIRQVTVALPSNLSLSSVTSQALNLNVLAAFKQESLDIFGANNHASVPYNVFIYEPAIPFATTDTYTITIK